MINNSFAISVNLDNELENSFYEFLNKHIIKWAENTYKKIVIDVKKHLSLTEEKTLVKKIAVSNYKTLNKTLGATLRDADLEFHLGDVNMYWNGNLKLDFTANIKKYTKERYPFTRYYMQISLYNGVKTFMREIEKLTENSNIVVTLDATVYDGNGLKITIPFDTLDETYSFSADCDYVLQFVSLNLSYVVNM